MIPKKISVIIPVYNVENYIEQCIESVLSQTYKNLEVIIINDGSTDDSPRICEEYAIKDNRIRVIHKANGGVSSARNEGIRISTGDYILFLDSDDYIEDGIISTCCEIITKYDIDMILFNYKTLDCLTGKLSNSKMDYSTFHNHKFKPVDALNKLLSLYPNFHWFPWQFLIRRSIIVENSLFFEDGLVYEDAKLVYKLFLNCNSISFTNASGYIYRINRSGSITKAIKLDNEIDRINVIKDNISWVNENINQSIILKERLNNNFSCMIYASYVSYYFIPKENRELIYKALKENKKILKYIKYGTGFRLFRILCEVFGIRIVAFLAFIRAIIKYKDMR